MKELKIDPKLQALFKPLPKKELEELREKLITKYDGTPLYIWKEEIIVDGHNRYPILKENNIDFKTTNVEDFLGQDCTKADVMQWMISHQQARRNLELGELIYANSMVAEEIALENEEKRRKGGSIGGKGGYQNEACVQMDASLSKERDRSTNTREQVAKMSGVGVGTVARYDAVMKSDNEDLKRKVRTGEVKVGTAYREVKNRETRVCKECKAEKKIIEFFGNDTTCKECARKKANENVNSLRMMNSKPTEENMKVYEDVTTSRIAKDYINQDSELNWLRGMCEDFIGQINDRFFNLLCAINKMDKEHINEANDIFEDFVSDVFDIQEKFNKQKEN